MLKRKAEKAGIDKRIHAHGLRHSGAAELRAEGMDIGIISIATGVGHQFRSCCAGS